MMEFNWTLFWEVINFLVLLVLMTRFLYKPIMRMIDQRREMIQKDLSEASDTKKKAAELKQSYEAKLQAARNEAHEIIAQAEKRGHERREEIIAEAQNEATRMKERAMEEIAQAKRQALSQVRDEVAGISLLVAEKFLQESVDSKRHQHLVNEFIQQLDRQQLGDAKC